MSEFKEGYENFVRLDVANWGAKSGADYIVRVEEEIDKLVNAINGSTRVNEPLNSLKGFLAEDWHAGAFNINAVIRGSNERANVPDNNGIYDIKTEQDGKLFQVKYYKNGVKSAKQQAKINLELYKKYCNRCRNNGQEPTKTLEEYLKEKNPNDPYYLGQGRVIPTDQMKDAQEWLKKQILKESKGGRSEMVKRYQETLDMLTDRLKSSDGTQSIPLTEEEAKQLARDLKEGGIDPADYGLTTENLVTPEYIMKQAFKAGLSAALVTMVLKIAPEICGMICKLIKEGKIDVEQFKCLGFAAVKGGAEGFIRGTVAAAVTSACKAGLMGTALKSLNPSIIGAITAIAMNTIQNACLLSFKKISKHEFANRCSQDLFVTACSIGAGIGGAALFPQVAVLGYMIGSFVGSVVGTFVYKSVYSCIISFCVESGSTFFGLVEQNYKLPKEILEEIGIKVFEYKKFEPKKFEPQKFEIKRFEYNRLEPVQIDVTFLRRGVIGVGVIGYI